MNYLLTLAVILITAFTLETCTPGPLYQVNSQATMNKSCIANAQSQLSPQWAQGSTFERGIVALQVIRACEEKTP